MAISILVTAVSPVTEVSAQSFIPPESANTYQRTSLRTHVSTNEIQTKKNNSKNRKKSLKGNLKKLNPTTEPAILTSGFNPEIDGFGFANWSEQFTDSTSAIELLVSIFGFDSICSRNSAPDTCVPFQSAASFASSMNSQLAYGRCEGMVVLASKLFNDRKNGLRSESTVELSKDQVASQITFLWGTQILPNVNAESLRTRKLRPSEFIDPISKAIKSRATSTLGIYQGSAGHALLPIAMKYEGSIAVIDVYDSNTPRITQQVIIDPLSESWTFVAKDATGTKLMDWSGSGAGTLDLIPIDLRTPQSTTYFSINS